MPDHPPKLLKVERPQQELAGTGRPKALLCYLQGLTAIRRLTDEDLLTG
jgi:hypothetical protein